MKRNLLIILIIIIVVLVMLLVLLNKKNKFETNYNVKSKLVEITDDKEIKNALKDKSIIIFVGNKNKTSKKYAKELVKLSDDYNKAFIYYESSNIKIDDKTYKAPVLIGIDKEKNKEIINNKTKINENVDKLFNDITNGACGKEEAC